MNDKDLVHEQGKGHKQTLPFTQPPEKDKSWCLGLEADANHSNKWSLVNFEKLICLGGLKL
jgi:hypothetical protein